MLEHALADGLVIVHFAFIAFVVAGGLLVLRRRWVAWLHVPAVVWGAAIEVGGWICPLTPWENQLRLAAGERGYTGGFIEHYIIPIIYPSGLTRRLQWILAGLVVVVNAFIYAAVIVRARRRAGRGA